MGMGMTMTDPQNQMQKEVEPQTHQSNKMALEVHPSGLISWLITFGNFDVE